MTTANEREIAEMFARCEDLIVRSQELGAEHNAVMEELERLLTAIDAALRRTSKMP